MKLKVYVVELDLSSRQKKIVRAAVVTGAVIGALGIGVAIAAPIDTTWITGGAQVSATSLKTDLDGLQTQITAGRFVGTIGGQQYSVGATAYVGVTATFNGLQVGGYTGAKQKCQAAFMASSHMCTTEELARSAQTGVAMPANPGWYSASTRDGTGVGSAITNDCFGWSDSTAGGNNNGAIAYQAGSTVAFSLGTCDQTNPILCCD
jgi:hypothetical protein